MKLIRNIDINIHSKEVDALASLLLIIDASFLFLLHEIRKLIKSQMQGWVILRDTASLIELARSVATQVKWDARVIELDSNSDEKLQLSQKPFFRKQ